MKAGIGRGTTEEQIRLSRQAPNNVGSSRGCSNNRLRENKISLSLRADVLRAAQFFTQKFYLFGRTALTKINTYSKRNTV